MTHTPDKPEYWRDQDRAVVEAVASGVMTHSGTVNVVQLGLAKAELIRRDREHVEAQEQSRRLFERHRDTDRVNHDLRMFEEAGLRETSRREFEDQLARRQMDHTAALAKEQLSTAQSAAKAARMAAWAAVAAAVGAILQVLVAAIK